MSLGTRSAVYVVASMIQKLAAVLLLPVYTLLLDPTEYGYYSLLTNFFLVLSTVGALGYDYGVVKFCRPQAGAPSAIAARNFSAMLTGSIVFSLVLVIGCLMLLPLYTDALVPGLTDHTPVILAVIAAGIQPIILICISATQAVLETFGYVMLTLGYFLVNAASLICGVLLSESALTAAVGALLFTNVVFGAVGLWFCRRRSLLTRGFTGEEILTTTRYSLLYMPHSLMLHLSNLGVRVIVSNVISVAAAGLYTVAFFAATVIDAAQTAMYRAYLPWFFGRVESGTPTLHRDLNLVITGMVLVGTAITATVASLGPLAIYWATPSSFDPAAEIVALLALAMAAKSVYYPCLAVIMHDTSGSRGVLAISGGSTVASVVTSIPAALLWGLWGVVVVQIVQRIAMSAMTWRMARSREGYTMPWSAVGACLATSVAVCVGLTFLGTSGSIDPGSTADVVLRIGVALVVVSISSLFGMRVLREIKKVGHVAEEYV